MSDTDNPYRAPDAINPSSRRFNLWAHLKVWLISLGAVILVMAAIALICVLVIAVMLVMNK